MSITCDKCQRGLSQPFTSKVFLPDGSEYEVKNKLPPGVGKNSVVVYIHDDCGKTWQESAKIIGREKRPYMRHVDLASARRREMSTAQALRNLGFAVSSRGHRFLMVFPRLLANEVKKIQK